MEDFLSHTWEKKMAAHAGLPDISRYNTPKRVKIYQMIQKYTEWP
jgi:hypothetical protein